MLVVGAVVLLVPLARKPDAPPVLVVGSDELPVDGPPLPLLLSPPALVGGPPVAEGAGARFFNLIFGSRDLTSQPNRVLSTTSGT